MALSHAHAEEETLGWWCVYRYKASSCKCDERPSGVFVRAQREPVHSVEGRDTRRETRLSERKSTSTTATARRTATRKRRWRRWMKSKLCWRAR